MIVRVLDHVSSGAQASVLRKRAGGIRLARLCGVMFTLCFCLLSGQAQAAQQGARDTVSTAQSELFLILGLRARITGFADLALGTWSGTGDLAGDDNLCVGRNGVGFFGQAGYRIRASGDGAPGDPAAFTLTNGARTVTYDAFFNDQPGTLGRQRLTAGVTLANQNASGFTSIFNLIFGCAFNNANVSVVIPESVLQSAAGNYSGTLTLTMIPE